MSKLSEKVRPNVEAAPWVIYEIANLEDQLTEAQAEIERLREALEKVFYTASPTASRNEWVCFKAADEALAKYAEGKEEK